MTMFDLVIPVPQPIVMVGVLFGVLLLLWLMARTVGSLKKKLDNTYYYISKLRKQVRLYADDQEELARNLRRTNDEMEAVRCNVDYDIEGVIQCVEGLKTDMAALNGEIDTPEIVEEDEEVSVPEAAKTPEVDLDLLRPFSPYVYCSHGVNTALRGAVAVAAAHGSELVSTAQLLAGLVQSAVEATRAEETLAESLLALDAQVSDFVSRGRVGREIPAELVRGFTYHCRLVLNEAETAAEGGVVTTLHLLRGVLAAPACDATTFFTQAGVDITDLLKRLDINYLSGAPQEEEAKTTALEAQREKESEVSLPTSLAKRHQLARTSTDAKIIERLSQDDEWWVREGVALNPSVAEYPEIIERLSRDVDWWVRRGVALNPSVAEYPEIIQRLSQDRNWEVREGVARNLGVAELYPEIIEQLSRDRALEVRRGVALNPSVVEEEAKTTALQAQREKESEVSLPTSRAKRHQLARTSTDAKIIERLSQDDDRFVRRGVALNPSVPALYPNIIERLSQDDDWYVREGVARNPSVAELYPEISERLSRDRDLEVRRGVALNPSVVELYPELIRRLSEDQDAEEPKNVFPTDGLPSSASIGLISEAIPSAPPVLRNLGSETPRMKCGQWIRTRFREFRD